MCILRDRTSSFVLASVKLFPRPSTPVYATTFSGPGFSTQHRTTHRP